MKGIDVSKWQGVIDWDKVKKSGVGFAIIRAGYGDNNVDIRFKANIEGALRVGIPVGVYWFMYGDNNALKFYDTIKPYLDKITFGIWADWEYDSDKQYGQITKEQRTNIVKKFCNKLVDLGCKNVGIYANLDYLNNKFYDLSMYPLWYAQYSTKRNNKYKCVMWQYSSSGKVNGINGAVDMNEYYGSVEKAEEVEYNMPTIKRGSKGKAVKIWQIIIGVNPDGDFGTKTDEATKNYQSDHNLSVDGVVGENSWRVGLNNL